jgi:hypothetical protein
VRSAYAGLILLLLLLAQCAYALPTTQDVAFKNTSSVLFYATGVTTPSYFKYGTISGQYTWLTENQSNASALHYTWEHGVPLMSGRTFYFRVCDVTGCGIEKTVVMSTVTVAPTTTFNVLAMNITRSEFNLATIGQNIIEPYTWVTSNPNILFGVLLFFVFTGLWLRQREVIIPIILGMIASGLLMYQGTNSVGIPPEMFIIVVALVTLGLGGVVMGLYKR